MAKPKAIHDFHGFPRRLFEVDYPAPGDPGLARQIREMITETPIMLDEEFGLDHGTWSILCRMFPEANIPTLQPSLDCTQSPAGHYHLGQALRKLRHEGVLIMGGRNIVHNLGQLIWKDTAYGWAVGR